MNKADPNKLSTERHKKRIKLNRQIHNMAEQTALCCGVAIFVAFQEYFVIEQWDGNAMERMNTVGG